MREVYSMQIVAALGWGSWGVPWLVADAGALVRFVAPSVLVWPCRCLAREVVS
jgi:hypothetical protein